MLRSRLVWKLYAGYAFVVVFTAVTVAVAVLYRVEEDARSEIRQDLLAEALLLKELSLPALSGTTDATLQARVEELGKSIPARLTVVQFDGAHGKVIADSWADPTTLEDHGDRPEIQAALRSPDGIGTSTRFSDSVERHLMYVAVAVRNGAQTTGFVRTSLPVTFLGARLLDLRLDVARGALIAGVATLFLGFLVSHRITRRLTSLAEVAQSIARGQYERRVLVGSRDEIGDVAQAFNEMALELSSRMDTIIRDRNKVLTILSGMVEGVLAVDRDCNVMHLNEVAARIFNASAKDCTGRPLSDVVSLEEVREIVTATLSEATGRTAELRIEEGARGAAILEMCASPLWDGNRRLAGVVVLLHDVTRLRHLEMVRRDFIANVSHELKTPVAAIRALVETLTDGGELDPATRDRFLGKVSNQASRLSSLVTDLLTLSRMESQGYLVERRPIDLRGPLEDSCRAAQADAAAKSLTISVEVPDRPVMVNGEEEGLRQVVDNLLSNAVKYTAEGKQIWARVFAEGSNAVVEVEDTGIGIGADHIERIFERFYRVDKARSRELGGTGLGLSIVKHFAAAHGGQVTVRSEPGKGSTFRVRLPLVGSHAIPAQGDSRPG